jgi:hypothetical protein
MNIKDYEACNIAKNAFGKYVHSVGEHLATLICISLFQVAGKQAAYHGLTEYYQSLVCKANKSVGEEIARLEVSCFYIPPSSCVVR